MKAADAADGEEWQQHGFSVEYVLPLIFTRDAFDPANPNLRRLLALREPQRRHRMAVFADAGLLQAQPALPARIAAYAVAHADGIELAGEVVSVPGGEACKNDPHLLESLLAALAARRIDRHSYAVAIGGGAVLDAVGYAAAIFHRGVRHIRFPSTVLAQGDSGVGVKNALNWQGQKNLVGTFSPPWGVINDAAFIDLLPLREKRAGLAEAVKVALIRDRDFFCGIEEDAAALAAGDAAPLTALIRRSAGLHMRQISRGGDPFERGSARPLDFGHWAAHKLERLSGHALSHGEAVAIGIALDARYSVLAGLLAPGAELRIHGLLARLGFRLWHPLLLARTAQGGLAVLAGLDEFREHLGGELSVTLLAAIGEGVEAHAMDPRLVLSAAAWLREQEGGLACA
ncbi:3-dehydroquinate synthase [Massilia sp. YIM B04103]|uniref:3-dehydroquinate synthase n=1 Tax=Massilia sp. YIM B04103 TaxID=2963106 RepID=UPI002109FC23|nr:3-dehydroquinate synthase [Massilia sp. YIM B04103]